MLHAQTLRITSGEANKKKREAAIVKVNNFLSGSVQKKLNKTAHKGGRNTKVFVPYLYRNKYDGYVSAILTEEFGYTVHWNVFTITISW